ncbi:MAG: DUF362 domain-containing protein [Deltaproteobacteria bacterium]|nr:DUF362 domain-containing protein [Deltaproteobacteria bacterium]
MSQLDGIGLQFDESMSGVLTLGETGQASDAKLEVRVSAEDLDTFLAPGRHQALLSGTFTWDHLGAPSTIESAVFRLFDVSADTGHYQLVYEFRFTAPDATAYFFHGEKDVHHEKGKVDVLDDMTRMRVKVHAGEDAAGPVVAEGEMRFSLLDLPSLVRSMKVTGTSSPWKQIAARVAFLDFVYGVLRDEYLKSVTLLYDTRYENLVLSGWLEHGGTKERFFLVSGVHDRGFPWGDGEIFWDVLLIVGSDEGWRRYCITDRVLPGLEVDVDHGRYRYKGPLFLLKEGYSTSMSEMKKGSANLVACDADFSIDFEAKAYDTAPFPFPVVDKHLRHLTSELAHELEQLLPAEHPLGVFITPHTVTVKTGTLGIQDKSGGSTLEQGAIDPVRTFGEAERSTLRNIKEPTLLYNYVCAVDAHGHTARVQIDTRTLRDEREHFGKDRLDAIVGTVVSREASAEILLSGGTETIRHLMGSVPTSSVVAPRFVKLGPPLLEVSNDHFPTAIFQRRIIDVLDSLGDKMRALEEDMRWLRCEPVGSTRTAKVAAFQGDDKHATLDRVLEATGFFALVEQRYAERGAGCTRDQFSIVIKPNFMFAYDRRDPSTYTDPKLVAHLARRLVDKGFSRISVVEAQSAYGQYFDKRSVREMADYLGFCGHDELGKVYDVVDLTEDSHDMVDFAGPLGRHPVPWTWRDAGMRISFAKNKTHAYAYYTLTLKNIYGALALADKFQEYHCKRGIYGTTIEYLQAYPVDFGLIDGYLSADGPFGVFADTVPNPTHTIVGGDDLVAVDWVGASKMGIDPRISEFMRLAVERFGKPAIDFQGDCSIYRPWLNVPVALTLFTNKGLDADHTMGNLLYAAAAQMDETHFKYKNATPLIRWLRTMTVPLRRTFFLRTGEDPSWTNRLASWALWKLGA